MSAVLGMSACATNKEPSSANQAVNQQRAASSAPYGYACYDDFGQPVYYYDAASPGYCTHRPVYVVQQRPSPVIAPSRTLPPSQRAPLPVPDRIGVLGR
ncbi:MAG TPA: hypothetical protein VJM11_07770 [Nevskiaceae bacterium]|nr:hypothetical protein [Nevskiaceae bacterium]